MPALRIRLDVEERGFDSIEDLKLKLGIPKHPDPEQVAVLGQHMHHLGNDAVIEVGGLANGTSGGAPSVAFCFNLPGGDVVLAETTLALLLTAADTLKARFGDPRLPKLYG